MASSYMDVPFYGSITLRMSTRRLYVILFVFSFRVTYILLFVAWCPMVAEEFLFPSARRRENKYTTFHSLLLIVLLSPPLFRWLPVRLG